MVKKVSLRKILQYLNTSHKSYEFDGDQEAEVEGFSSLKNYKEGSIAWIKSVESIPADFNETIDAAVIQSGESIPDSICIKNKIISSESKKIYFSILDELFVEKTEQTFQIGQGTYLSPNVKLGRNVSIGYNCVLDGNITIGDNTKIYHNVTIINNVTIGRNCDIESGVNIGHDGYAFTENEGHEKSMIKHYGGVTIGDNVHIGGQTHVARGTLDDTIIEDGVKIDTLIHIAHNCKIGRNSALIAGSLIYGSAELGSNVQITSGIVRNQMKMGDNSFAGIGSVVLKDVPEETTVIGIPAKPLKKE